MSGQSTQNPIALQHEKRNRHSSDISGKRFGRLVVICDSGNRYRNGIIWFCQCDCGKTKNVRGQSLKQGRTKSCGCSTVDFRNTHMITHGKSKYPEYKVWKSMMDRCQNKRHKQYPSYGGRGIYVCDRWKESIEDFLEDMGRRPSKDHSIDRIDNDGPYTKENCRWATRSQQQCNRRGNRWIQFNGKNMTLSQWSKTLQISTQLLRLRIKKWGTEKALTTVGVPKKKD